MEKDYQSYLKDGESEEYARDRVNKILAMMPDDADPGRWVPKPADFDRVENVTDEQAAADAQRAWEKIDAAKMLEEPEGGGDDAS